MVDTKLVKSAGEHWVCSTLSQLGWAVALTRDGLERVDILAVNVETRRTIEIQVKTASFSRAPNWRVNTKAQQPAVTDREWFVFVALASQPWLAPRAFIAPRDHVAAAAWIRHQDWLTDPDVAPGRRNTGIEQARLEDWVLAGYENRWDLLAGAADAAPVLLPERFHGLARCERVGLPSKHPWLEALPSW